MTTVEVQAMAKHERKRKKSKRLLHVLQTGRIPHHNVLAARKNESEQEDQSEMQSLLDEQ